MSFAKVLIVFWSVLVITHTAHAAGVKDCDAALIKATYSQTDKQFIDWRLAEQVDEGSYNSAKAEAGGSAVIYGVPVGANYSQFKENIQTLKRTTTQSFTSDTFRNVAWTGLDPNSVTTYSDCLKALSQKNLVLIPRTATSSDVSFDLIYTVIGAGKNPLPIKWTGIEAGRNALPTKIFAGSTPIVVRRPKADSTLAASGSGLSDSIIVTPMPKQLSPQELYLSTCQITKTPQPLPQLAAGQSTTWTCPVLQGGDYDVSVSMKPSASGAFRVLYSLDVVVGSGEKARSKQLNSGNMDINAPGAGLPDVFQGSNSVTVKDGEVTRVRLTISGVANHCCFGTTGHKDGTVLVPEGISIVLKRAG